MQAAFRMALQGRDNEEVPVGAVIVHEGRIIARAHNQIEALNDPTAHAEMIAITQATSFLKSKVLNEADLYVTLEPCPMCAMAIVLSKIRKIFFATPDPRTGACGSVFNIAQHSSLNHKVALSPGLMQTECAQLLKEFFRKRR